MWKQTGAGTTRTYFVYDGTQPVLELTSTGAFLATNVFGADGLISRRTGGSSVFYAFDDRGNAVQSLYSTGNSYYVFEYDVWGNRTAPVNTTPGPWDMGAQYGYYTDTETGLSLLTHRFYNPTIGRFLTRDPMGYGGGVNLYGYTKNDPVNRNDPSGYCPICFIIPIVIILVLSSSGCSNPAGGPNRSLTSPSPNGRGGTQYEGGPGPYGPGGPNGGFTGSPTWGTPGDTKGSPVDMHGDGE